MSKKNIRETTIEILEAINIFSRLNRNLLTKNEIEYLEYFWNAKSIKRRTRVYLDFIFYSRNNDFDDSAFLSIKKEMIKQELSKLRNKGFVEEKEDILNAKSTYYELTKDGLEFVINKHPKFMVLIERFIDKIPKVIQFIFVTLITIIASILGIIQFFNPK